MKASATAAGACRTRSEPWSARASRSTTARAWPSSTAASALLRERRQRRLAGERGSPRGTPPPTRAPGAAPAARRGRRRCPIPPRSRGAAAGGRAAAGPTPRRSRCRRGTRAPRPHAPGPRLQIQYFATAVAMRANAASAGSCARRSYARASRSAVTVAASDSTQRSASTLRISGCSASGAPNATRCAAWCVACSTACRMPGRRAEDAVEPRVDDHLDDRRARRALPRRRAAPSAPSSSISLDAFERSPSLSLSRSMRKPLREPSGSTRGRRKHDRPRGRLREHEERVAHRRRAEPLLPVERRTRRRRPAARGRVRADVGAALPLGHRHADERAALLGRRPQAEVVLARREQRLPLRRERRAPTRAAPAPRRASSRSGTRGPPRPARRA